MKRRDFLVSVGGSVGAGAAGGVLTYEFLLDTYVRRVYNSIQPQSDQPQSDQPQSDQPQSDQPQSEEMFDLQSVSEVDVFLIAGQSNAVGQGNADESPSPPSDTAAEYSVSSENGFEVLADPVGFARYPAGTGSAWPAFANTYWEETNSPSVYIPTAIGGTGVHPDSDTGAVWGGPNGLLYRALGHLRGALNNLDDAGIRTNFRGVLWHQGERDAKAIDNSQISLSDFREEFTDMIRLYRSEVGNDQAKFWIFQIGRPRDDDTSGFQHVREVQREVAEDDEHSRLVFDECVNFPEEGKMTDGVHYNQEGLNEMGRTGAANIVDELSLN